MKDLVIGMGEALWDVLPDGKKIGGAPANFAYHVSQFGIPSLAISAIGDDALGKELLENFDAKDVKYHIDTVPYPTGTVQVELDEAGVPQYEIKENVAWDNIPATEELKSIAADTKAFCFGSLAQRNIVSRTTINEFLQAIPKENDPLIVFDVNLRQSFYTKEVLCNSMKACNILKINDEELVTVFTPGEVSFLPTPMVEVADTVGAGDSFTAAFIASILRGKSVPEAHHKAVTTSAFVCTQHGAMPVLPADITD